jgi:hypothetical protein
MNERASPKEASPDLPAEQVQPVRSGVASVASRWLVMLNQPDRAALFLFCGLSVLGVISGVRVVLGLINQADFGATAWVMGLLSALYLFLAHSIAGVGMAALIHVLAGRPGHDARPAPLPEAEARLRLAAVAPDPTPSRAEASKDDTVTEIRRSIQAGQWSEARLLLDVFSDDFPDDPRLFSLQEELRSARAESIESHAAQLDAARKVNDPERVLELHRGMLPLLDAEARASLEADLSKWFLKLIHNRLRTGKIQTDVAILAGRIADVFSHTVEGASLRASLPTLRRSAGLCPRCAQPYTGLGNACLKCLAVPGPSPQTTGSPGD